MEKKMNKIILESPLDPAVLFVEQVYRLPPHQKISGFSF